MISGTWFGHVLMVSFESFCLFNMEVTPFLFSELQNDKKVNFPVKLCKNYFPQTSLKSLNVELQYFPKISKIPEIPENKKSLDSGFDENTGEPNLKKALQKNDSKIQFAAFEKDLILGEGDEKTKMRKSSTPFKKIEKLNLQKESIWSRIFPRNINFRRYLILSSIFQLFLCVVTVVCLKMSDIISSP